MSSDFSQLIAEAAIVYPVLLFSLSFHEVGHAVTARWFGDRTAEAQGRITMNPLVHMDPIGTFLFPLLMLLTPAGKFLFGWAKPVPVNPLNLRRFKDIVWVSLAGPACNLILVVVGVILYKLYLVMGHKFDPNVWMHSRGDAVQMFLYWWLQLNLVLMLFNLIPVTPLDGSRVVLANVPGHSRMMPFWQFYERYGFVILLGLLFTGVLQMILKWPMILSLRLILRILGV